MSSFRSSEEQDGKTISIQADIEEVWMQTESKTLFVRSCYKDIWHKVAQHYFSASDGAMRNDEETADGFVISGTPGVGKSCFLDFALHKLLSLGKTVLYLHGKTSQGGIFKADAETVEKYSIADIIQGSLASTVDFILIDPPEGGDPNFFGGHTNLKGKKFILAVSPDRNNCQSIRKDTTTLKLYMGTCLLEEAEEMRLACYEQRVTLEQLRSRFNEFGGIPRYLFKRFLDEDDSGLDDIRGYQTVALHDVITNPTRVDNLEMVDPFKSLWTLYHMEPITQADGAINYKRYTIRPCCNDAGARIRDELMKKSVQDLWDTFTSTRQELGALRIIRYEAYAHKKILSAGLTGTATGLKKKGLSSVVPKAISIPAGSTKIDLPNNNVGQDLQNAVAHARTLNQGVYLLPHLSNYPVVDSVFVPSAAGTAIQLQMKAGRSRSLSTENAKAVASATGSEDLYFIVPDEVTMHKRLEGANNLRQYSVILREV